MPAWPAADLPEDDVLADVFLPADVFALLVDAFAADVVAAVFFAADVADAVFFVAGVADADVFAADVADAVLFAAAVLAADVFAAVALAAADFTAVVRAADVLAADVLAAVVFAVADFCVVGLLPPRPPVVALGCSFCCCPPATAPAVELRAAPATSFADFTVAAVRLRACFRA